MFWNRDITWDKNRMVLFYESWYSNDDKSRLMLCIAILRNTQIWCQVFVDPIKFPPNTPMISIYMKISSKFPAIGQIPFCVSWSLKNLLWFSHHIHHDITHFPWISPWFWLGLSREKSQTWLELLEPTTEQHLCLRSLCHKRHCGKIHGITLRFSRFSISSYGSYLMCVNQEK